MPSLRELMSDDLATVSQTTTVAEAAQIMSLRRIGAALVVDGEELLGIFTERDIVRALAAEHDAATHEVGEWMTKDPFTLDAEASAHETLALMLAKGFRHVPVTEGGRLVGIVSMRDLSIR
jgi:CBS domain-containing protein